MSEELTLYFSPHVMTVISAKGPWSATTDYVKGDLVSDNGYSYIAIQNVPAGTALTNTSYWQVLSARGPQGDTGVGISNITLNNDYTLTITYTDNTTVTTPSIRGAAGNGIASAVLNNDYTLTLTFEDGNTYTSPSIRGATGAPGVGIMSIYKTGQSGLDPVVDEYTILYTDYTMGSFSVTNGKKGDKGDPGVSPSIAITTITGGHRVAVTDANGTQTFDVMDATIDATLTQAGEAADAKVTGDKISNIVDALPIKTVSGAAALISDSAGYPAESLVVDIDPVQSGSGTPAPGNIRDISGWSAINAFATGKNIYNPNMALEYGYINKSNGEIVSSQLGKYTKDYTPIKPNTTYIWSFPASASGNIYFAVFAYDSNKNFIGRLGISYPDDFPITFTTPSNAAYVRFNLDLTNPNMQLEEGSTATAYEAFGNAYTTQLGQTVYGGTLDIVSGELTITHDYIASYSGESLPGEWISDRDVYAEGTTPTTGAEVVYELASPTTVQLTGQQVDLLTGLNNVWADSGDVSVTYKPKLKNAVTDTTLTQSGEAADAKVTGDRLSKTDLKISSIVANNPTYVTLSAAMQIVDGIQQVYSYQLGTTIAFSCDANTVYEVEAVNNNRLRVYGVNVSYDINNISLPVNVEAIVENDGNSATFNSGDHKTIFIYLANSGTPTLTKLTAQNAITELDALAEKAIYDLVPEIQNSIPATTIKYHELWDDLVTDGLVTRSAATYLTGDTDHIYPLYTYNFAARDDYMISDYSIAQDLSNVFVRPKMLVVSGQHGDEIATPYVLFKFVERLFNDPNYKWLLTMYDWTIIPLVNPTGYNARTRRNANNVDINRDYNDSTGFATEEAAYVRDALIATQFVWALDMHQAPLAGNTASDPRCGFISMNQKRTSESQDDYDNLYGRFCKTVTAAGSKTDAKYCVANGLEDKGQFSFIWDYPNNLDMFRNYAAGTVGNTLHTDKAVELSAVFETSTVCAYLTGNTAKDNNGSVEYTNIYADEIIRALMQMMDA